MKTQTTSTARRQQLLGTPFHTSTRSALSINIDEAGKTNRSLRTSTLELRWIGGEIDIRCRASEVQLVKASR
ncbi:hypothetical protein [Comamonas odontotermitis]|uniref:hypothetical protein n=1 Tax=Comamonas odontotermitis TaxID=379895 RepID=UPI001CC7C2A6|nr:hypothetical protein [Comamonas odontotermitis]UBB17780.1 hypothetical protein LAD35_03800 [Comamonas odontotermitis]